MAVFTELSLAEARALGARWGLDVIAREGLAVGSVNTSYGLTLAGGARVFLRIYEAQPVDAVAVEARLLDHLAGRGVPTPRPLPLAAGCPGALVSEHAGKPVVVFPWVEGETICQRLVTPARARLVGDVLARIHLAGASFEGASPGRFRAEDLSARLAPIEAAPPTEEIGAAARALRARLDRRLGAQPAPDAPVIHGDLFRDNVLWSNGVGRDSAIAATLDFESASRGSPTFDLMVTVLAWCFGDALDMDLARALVAGYASARPITSDERVRLHEEAIFAAVRFSITRIIDFELRSRGTGTYKDYRRFLARLDAIEAVDASAWPAMLDL